MMARLMSLREDYEGHQPLLTYLLTHLLPYSLTHSPTYLQGEDYEGANHGEFELLYPSPRESLQHKYTTLLDASHKSYLIENAQFCQPHEAEVSYV